MDELNKTAERNTELEARIGLMLSSRQVSHTYTESLLLSSTAVLPYTVLAGTLHDPIPDV